VQQASQPSPLAEFRAAFARALVRDLDEEINQLLGLKEAPMSTKKKAKSSARRTATATATLKRAERPVRREEVVRRQRVQEDHVFAEMRARSRPVHPGVSSVWEGPIRETRPILNRAEPSGLTRAAVELNGGAPTLAGALGRMEEVNSRLADLRGRLFELGNRLGAGAKDVPTTAAPPTPGPLVDRFAVELRTAHAILSEAGECLSVLIEVAG